MNAARYLPLGFVAVLLDGCTYPEFDFGTGGAGAAAGQVAGVADTTTSTSTGLIGGGVRPTTGSGVTSSSSSSSVTTGVTSATSGGGVCVVTHQGGGTCEYLPDKECGCVSDKKCSVTKEATGEAQCVNHGVLQQGQVCSSDSACDAGFWCDHFTGTCTRICEDDADCLKGKCFNALNSDDINTAKAIPGLRLCTANCNPLTAQPCGNGATCTFDSTIDVFDCFVSVNKTEGQSCTKLSDCGKGLACLAPGTCVQWCVTAADCKNGKTKCTPFNPAVTVGGTSYGFCQ